MKVSATFYQAGSDQSQLISVNLDESGLSYTNLDDSSAQQTFDFDQLSISEKLGELPSKIYLPSGAILEFKDSAFDKIIRNKLGTNLQFINWFERNKLTWLVCAILVPICFYIFIDILVPKGAKYIVKILPYSVSRNVEIQALDLLEGRLIKPTKISESERFTLQQQFASLITRLELDANKYQLLLRESEAYGANAFALPGGTIVVTDELYQLFKQKPEAINAILLHEIAHIEQQHGMQLLAESISTSLFISYFFGDLQGMAELFSGTAVTLVQNTYSRDLEVQADDYAMAKLALLGYSVQGFVDAMQGLVGEDHQESKLFEYLNSHPQISKRIEKAQQQMQQHQQQ